MPASDPVTAALNLGSSLIDRVFPSQAEKSQAQLALLQLAQNGELTKLTAAANIIQTEAASTHWLAANWRPITMLTFAALIVARWMGWAAPNLSEAEYIKLWDIVQLGLGGYVIGRTGEKVASVVAEAVKARKES